MIHELRQKYPLKDLLLLAELPRSTYYYYISKHENSARYQQVKQEILKIFKENKGRYGYRRITAALREKSIIVNHKVVQKLMKQLGLFCCVRMKKYNSYRGEAGKIAPNLLERHFKASEANQKWATDVTEFKINGEKIFLSIIIDLYNREVICYTLSRHPNFEMISKMLEKAFQKLPDRADGLILHSDQGWLYQIKPYQDMLASKGIVQSMSRKATCLDNAVVENFFGILKTELFYLEDFESVDQLQDAIVEYIDYYNNQRIKSSLNYLSPVQYRLRTASPS